MNGTLYGTTSAGGLSHSGTIYSISTTGVHEVLYRFRGGSDGSDPQSGLLDVNGTLYGTTWHGGRSGAGTVYTVSTSGSEKVLYAFKGGSDGSNPNSGLIIVNGKLYGTTYGGGSGSCYVDEVHGCGTVYSVSLSGAEKVRYRFVGGSDGANPLADLIDVSGVLYGTTVFGGDPNGIGTVYSVTPAGAEKVLHAFQGGSDGRTPLSGLIDVNGTLFGTTFLGGLYSACYNSGGCGTVYSISTVGAENVIYRFAGGSDGEFPQADLIDVNGVLYGTTTLRGSGASCPIIDSGCGTVYTVTTAGAEAVLYNFTGHKDGWEPGSPLTDVSGTLYGTTEFGGDHDVCCRVYGFGTVFALTP